MCFHNQISAFLLAHQGASTHYMVCVSQWLTGSQATTSVFKMQAQKSSWLHACWNLVQNCFPYPLPLLKKIPFQLYMLNLSTRKREQNLGLLRIEHILGWCFLSAPSWVWTWSILQPLRCQGWGRIQPTHPAAYTLLIKALFSVGLFSCLAAEIAAPFSFLFSFFFSPSIL